METLIDLTGSFPRVDYAYEDPFPLTEFVERVFKSNDIIPVGAKVVSLSYRYDSMFPGSVHKIPRQGVHGMCIAFEGAIPHSQLILATNSRTGIVQLPVTPYLNSVIAIYILTTGRTDISVPSLHVLAAKIIVERYAPLVEDARDGVVLFDRRKIEEVSEIIRKVHATRHYIVTRAQPLPYVPSSIWYHPEDRVVVDRMKTDARAVYEALYTGSGYAGGEIVRLRLLVGPTGQHCGLRPIRMRVLTCLLSHYL